MANVYVSIGSNLARDHNILLCLQLLQAAFSKLRVSKVYETPAEGCNGDPYLNLVAGFQTNYSPSELKTHCQTIENTCGRIRDSKTRFAPCALDIDILLYDDWNLQPDTNIPHRNITQCAFVLYPLAELAPLVWHALQQCTLQQLADNSLLSRSTLREYPLTVGLQTLI